MSKYWRYLSIPISFFVLCSTILLQAQSPVYQKLENGKVEHWYYPANQPNRFQVLVERFSNAIWPENKAPFGRSVALLIGVSDYKYLSPDLPSVKNDLAAMRKFLLGDGGFDEVYVIKDKNVTDNIIERYIKDELPKRVGRDGRLLFYFSGHGADKTGSNTGYMQFGQAEKSKFYGDYVLAINTVETWSNELEVKHFLVLLDCCSSGLAFSDKGGGQCDQAILRTLSGNGSRTVATAGTADQKTYALKARDGAGNGIFTKAFLNAFDNRIDNLGKCGLVTIDEILARMKRLVADFSAKYKKPLTPRLWTMNESEYRGSFVFVNPNGGKFEFTARQIASGQLVKKSGLPTGEKYGTIRVISQYDCMVEVDGLRGKITAGEAFDFFPVSIGKQSLKITRPGGFGAATVQSVDVLFNAKVIVTLRKQFVAKTDATPPAPPTGFEVTIQNQFVFKTPEVSDFSNFSPLYQLRSKSKKLSKTDVKSMLKKRSYFSKGGWLQDAWDNQYGAGIKNRYVLQKNGRVVYDATTGLTWQRSGETEKIKYEVAKEYVRKLNIEKFADYSDWRLPTLDEAMSLMEPQKVGSGLFFEPVFDMTQEQVWTSDSYLNRLEAWYIDFRRGYCNHRGIGFKYYVRAVR